MKDSAASFIGTTPAVRAVLEDAYAIAGSDSKVLISGESGVGKEVVARLIHQNSRRRYRPLLTINCAGVPEGLLESEFFGHVRGSFTGADRDRAGLMEAADTGTVMLDEVGEMSLRMQGMLLRFLESGEIQRVGCERARTTVDVRIIAATNRDLLKRVHANEFREDLYYRLNIVYLVIPPLRERRADIPLLLHHFLKVLGEQMAVPKPEFGPGVMQALEEYDWPGNVRELRNVVERLLLTRPGQVVTVDRLPLTRRPQAAAPVGARSAEQIGETCYRNMVEGGVSFWSAVYEPFMLRDMTRETVRHVVLRGLQQTKGNYRMVAELLNLPASDYKRFMNFLQKHDCAIPFQGFRAISPTQPRYAPPVSATPGAGH